MSFTKIAQAAVYDPANGIDGQVRDLYIRNGKIVDPPTDPDDVPDKVINAEGLVLMPGGVDVHCHIAGPKVNTARKLRPEEKRISPVIRRTKITRSGTTGSVPSTFATGYLYAGLGYTTAVDAAVPPLSARHAHEEFHDTPILDKALLVLMGNNHYIMDHLANDEKEKLTGYIAWLLGASKGYGIKCVNPGGVEVWKGGGGNVHGLDEKVAPYDVTPRQIVAALAQAGDELKLPHPVHIHCNNLGLPGNHITTMETMKALEGHRGHMAHIQFHSYAGDPIEQTGFGSEVASLAEYVNKNKNITVDVGQVLFGETTSLTGDGPLGYFLHQIRGRKWFSADTEMEAGCGIVPIEYKDKSFVNAMQWAIGLEWYLMVDDPWRIAMSTDHPNGGSFLAYPQIVQLLMDRTYRQEVLKTVHPRVARRSALPDLDREYTLNEIAIITRAGPARILGMSHKGHLGPGADADITIYTPNADKRKMFEIPRIVIKAGQVIAEEGHIRADIPGYTHYVAPDYDPGLLPDIEKWFNEYYTIRFSNYEIPADGLHHSQEVDCDAKT
jgi:formylmethanofuran dehydrogenase subunit A